jgi:hypothetical protein
MTFLHHILPYIKPPCTGYWLNPKSPWYFWLIGVTIDFLLVGGLVFGILQLVPRRLRKIVIIAVTFLAGLIFSLEFFIPAVPGTDKNFMSDFTGSVDQISTVIQMFAVGLGVYSLIRFHGKNIARLRPGWHNSAAFFVAFFAMLFAGFWKQSAHTPATIQTSQNIFDLIFQSTIVPLGGTMFSVIGFFIISAAYRAFRVRSAEATLMLIAAFIVMLGQVPIGAYMTSWIPKESIWGGLRLEALSHWILTKPNMAAQRGISFGVEIGALAMALRTWLSLERGSFFDQEL